MSKTGTSLRTKTPVNRHRYGDLNEVVLPVTTTKTNGRDEIATGELVWLPTATLSGITGETVGTVMPYTGILFTSVASPADNFLGVAMDSSATGDSDDVVVATSGVFEFACAQATITVGQAANFASGLDGDTNYISGYSVVPAVGWDADGVKNDVHRIGTIVSHGTTQTSVLVRIESKIFTHPA